MSGVVLRPLSENDLDGLFLLLNNSDNQDWVGGDLKPYSQNDVYQWWQNKINNPSTYFSAVDNDGQFCGYVQIVNINTTNGHGVVGINLLTNHQGVGLGFQAMTELHKVAKNNLCLRKVFLYVREDNQRAIHLYKKTGYELSGCLKKHVKTHNGYKDLFIWEKFL